MGAMTRHGIRRGHLLFAVLFFLLFASLAIPGAVVFAQEAPDLEEQAKALDKALICPVCPGETLNQSQTTLAKQMSAIIRERLVDGESSQEILDYFVSVYGDSVLAEPPKSGFSLTVWLVPPVAVAGGAVVVGLVIRNLRRRPDAPSTTTAGTVDQAELQEYLHLVDKELQEPKTDSDE
jgi:cytochrome c-type biogenesis protein CcmH